MDKDVAMTLGVVLSLDGNLILAVITVTVSVISLWKSGRVNKNKDLEVRFDKKVDDTEFEALKDKVKTHKEDVEKDMEKMHTELDKKAGSDVLEEVREQFVIMNESLSKLITAGNASVLSAVKEQGKRIDRVESRLDKTG